MRRVVAHITMPPCFWFFSACNSGSFTKTKLTMNSECYTGSKTIIILKENERKRYRDLLKLFQSLFNCCPNICYIVIYPVNNSPLLGNINLINMHTLFQFSGALRSKELFKWRLTWSMTKTDKSFIIWASSFTDSTTLNQWKCQKHQFSVVLHF